MDIFQFIAAVIGELAWPATVLTLVLLLRGPLGRVLLTLTKLKYKDLELDFGRELRQIEKQARAVEVLPAPQAKILLGPKSPLELLVEAEQLSAEFPEPAVAVAWSAVEDQLAQAAERVSGTTARRKPTSHAMKMLLQNGAIDRGTVNVLKRMMNLRNEVLHERWNAFGGVSPDEAREFIALARGINERLEGIGR